MTEIRYHEEGPVCHLAPVVYRMRDGQWLEPPPPNWTPRLIDTPIVERECAAERTEREQAGRKEVAAIVQTMRRRSGFGIANETIVRLYEEGFTHAEIAQRLGVSRSFMSNRVGRFPAELKARIKAVAKMHRPGPRKGCPGVRRPPIPDEQIIAARAAGKTYVELAAELGMSPKTAFSRMRKLRDRQGVEIPGETWTPNRKQAGSLDKPVRDGVPMAQVASEGRGTTEGAGDGAETKCSVNVSGEER